MMKFGGVQITTVTKANIRTIIFSQLEAELVMHCAFVPHVGKRTTKKLSHPAWSSACPHTNANWLQFDSEIDEIQNPLIDLFLPIFWSERYFKEDV